MRIDAADHQGPASNEASMELPLTKGWPYYFNGEAVDAATARVRDGGGQVLDGPHQVPGGSWIAHCFDPQGAMFAIVGSKR